MSKFEALLPNSTVKDILPDSLVTVVNVQRFGSVGLALRYETAATERLWPILDNINERPAGKLDAEQLGITELRFGQKRAVNHGNVCERCRSYFLEDGLPRLER